MSNQHKFQRRVTSASGKPISFSNRFPVASMIPAGVPINPNVERNLFALAAEMERVCDTVDDEAVIVRAYLSHSEASTTSHIGSAFMTGNGCEFTFKRTDSVTAMTMLALSQKFDMSQFQVIHGSIYFLRGAQ